jgi:hypothetical protein
MKNMNIILLLSIGSGYMATVWSGSVPEQKTIQSRLNQEKEISDE